MEGVDGRLENEESDGLADCPMVLIEKGRLRQGMISLGGCIGFVADSFRVMSPYPNGRAVGKNNSITSPSLLLPRQPFVTFLPKYGLRSDPTHIT